MDSEYLAGYHDALNGEPPDYPITKLYDQGYKDGEADRIAFGDDTRGLNAAILDSWERWDRAVYLEDDFGK